MTRTARNATISVLIVLLGSLGVASGASASDASVKAAVLARTAQFHKVAAQQSKAFDKWTKAHHSRKTSKPLLKTLKAAGKLENVDSKAVKAEAPSTAIGAQAKQDILQSNAYYSRYLTSLEKAVRLATKGKISAANTQIKLATGYAQQSAKQSVAAKKLLVQIS